MDSPQRAPSDVLYSPCSPCLRGRSFFRAFFPDELGEHAGREIFGAAVAEHVDDLGLGVVRVQADVEECVGAAADERLIAAHDRGATPDGIVE